jgi:very-short-patch-repair endonuclease
MPVGRYVVDFASTEIRLIIELDGLQHIDSQKADDFRTGFLQREGYKVVRFWNNDVLTSTDTVPETITRAVSRRQTEAAN